MSERYNSYPYIALLGLLVVFIAVAIYLWSNVRDSRDELSSLEIEKISKSVAAVHCGYFDQLAFGSGTYIRISTGDGETKDIVLTNGHVARSEELGTLNEGQGRNCSIRFKDGLTADGWYSGKSRIETDSLDMAALVLGDGFKNMEPLSDNGKPFPTCNSVSTGQEVLIFSYPAGGATQSFPDQIQFQGSDGFNLKAYASAIEEYNDSRSLVVTEGIISGSQNDNLITTASIDSGSSGGLAVSIESGEPCIVGVPTWLSVGEFQSIGLIQPMSRILTADIDWSSCQELCKLIFQAACFSV
jgi:hypothetical protein